MFAIANACLLSYISSASTQNPSDKKNGSIVIRNAIEFPVKSDPPLISVEYSYSFNGMKTVHVEGFGEAPSSAELSYLTRSNKIRILALDGSLLGEASIENVKRPKSSNADDLETNFTGVFVREEQYVGSEHFAIHLMKVMERQFPDGSERYEKDRITYCRSTPRLLRVGRLQVKVSVLVSYPHGDLARPTFQIQYRAMEKPSHDTWAVVSTEDAKKERDKFLDKLIAALRGD